MSGVMMSILLVDDDQGIRETMVEILNAMDFRVQVACDGYQAIESVRNNPNPFDVVLMDMRMPGIDGIETSIQIKKIHPTIKIIIVSGYVSLDIFNSAKSIGIQEILSKPVDFQKLVKLLGSK
jgi:DNA-binding NtrC family response regulator